MRLIKSYQSITIFLLLCAIGIATAIASSPSQPPAGGVAGGLFSSYFRNIIGGSGSISWTTDNGLCPAGQVIRGFSTGSTSYGLPICINPTSNDGVASSFTGSLRGTANYITKYNSTGTGLVNSQVFDNGTNIGIGTTTPTAKLEIIGGIKIVDGNQGSGKILTSDMNGLGVWTDAQGLLPPGTVMAFNNTVCPAGWVVADGTNGSPDLRGEFVRGLDMGRGVDAGRGLATAQVDMTESHTHAGNSAAGGAHTPTGTAAAAGAHTPTGTAAGVGDHRHTGNTNTSGNHAHLSNFDAGESDASPHGSDLRGPGGERSVTSSTNGDHSHSFTSNYAGGHGHTLAMNAIGDHVHTVAMNAVADHAHALSIAATGGAETRPRNVALLYCMKITAIGVQGTPSNSVTWTNLDGTSTGRIVSATTGNIGVGTDTPGQRVDVIGNIRATGQFISLASFGTAPLSVNSTTLNTNLNADLLDGQHGSYYATIANSVTIGGTQTITGSKIFSGDIRVNGLTVGKGGGNVAFNTAYGVDALANNNSTATSNTAIGYRAISNNVSGNNNTAIGWSAGGNNTTGSNNILVGYYAGNNITTGGNNIIIGSNIPAQNPTASNQINIGNAIYGENGNIGIGTGTNLTAKLNIQGPIRIKDGTEGVGKVLISDTDGQGTWQAMPGDLPVGSVMAFNGTSCPAGWVIADGANDTPDLRGEFVRGLDSGRGVDTGRALGSPQMGSIVMGEMVDNVASFSRIQNLGAYFDTTTDTTNIATAYIGGTTSILTADSGYFGVTRPRNIALLYCMKMTTTAATVSDPTTWLNVDGTASGRVSLATTGLVGIGTSTPTEKLEVVGSIKIVDGNQGTGKVLISDGSGKGTWKEMPGDLPGGTIMAFNGLTCPAGWVIADGSGGTPDLRGEFVRGLDMGRGIDLGRTLGSWQKGSNILLDANDSSAWTTLIGQDSVLGLEESLAGTAVNTQIFTVGAQPIATASSAYVRSIRPRNVALLYCMKITNANASLSDPTTWLNVDGTSSGRVSLATTGKVGIGTSAPTEKLEVVGSIKMVDGNQGTGKILISDGSGKAIWTSPEAGLPVGSVMAFDSGVCPAGWVIADGTNGTRDLRGEFIRGLDSGRGVDTGRALGSSQTDSIKEFWFKQRPDSNGNSPSASSTPPATSNVLIENAESSTTVTVNGTARTMFKYTVGAGNIETRPRNVALLYCMKITGVTAAASNNTTWQNMSGTATGNVSLSTTGNVGVGTSAPTEKLEVVGNIKIVDGNQGTGMVLTSDATGKAQWSSPEGTLPVGSVMAFNGTTCPAGWVIANGTLGSPDLRGEFIRGLDMGRGVDTGRTLGSAQAQDWKGFTMHNTVRNANTYSHDNVYMGKSTSTYIGNIFTGLWQAPGTAIGMMWDGSEIRPRNVALLYCMKITTVAATASNSTTWTNMDGTSTGRIVSATTGNIGIGTNTPTEKLEVVGNIKMVDGNQGTGMVLTSDANGKAQWSSPEGTLPIGSVMAFNGTTCPAGWVIANGGSGTPDLRGEFVRGLDSGRGVDTGRVLGSAQGGATRLLMNGSSIYNAPEGNSANGIIAHKNGVEMIGIDTFVWGSYVYRNSLRSAMDTTWGGASETRPRNVALLYCMKITTVAATPSNSTTWMNVEGTSTGNIALSTTGNVGIGTTAPTHKLEVGNSAIGGGFVLINRADSTGNEGGELIFAAGTNGDTAFRIDSYLSGVNQILRIRSDTTHNILNIRKDGNVGIGTETPTARLDVAGNIKVGPFYFDANDDTWLRLRDADGGAYKDFAAGKLFASVDVSAPAFYYNSDISLKKNLKKLESSLEKVRNLSGYAFDWKADGKSDIGVIAQEVEKIFPALVGESTDAEGKKIKTVKYGNLVAPLIEAIKELADKYDTLTQKIKQQETDIQELKIENEELRARLDAIEAKLAQ